MPKGYPRSRFDIVDQTQVQEITTASLAAPNAVIMATYTSDKGSEEWEMMYGLTDFSKRKGGIGYLKHGLPQLLVAEVLRNGGYVFGKRMVSSDATLANVTIKARIVTVDDVNYVYIYTSSSTSAGKLEEAAIDGKGDYNIGAEDNTDFPLFTITAAGRGASNIFIRISPEYSNSKSSSYIRYNLEVWEDQELLESILFTMNPDIVLQDISQSIQYKVFANSGQIQCKMFEDGIYGLVMALAKTATLNGEAIPASTLVDYDFINGKTRRGNVALGGIITAEVDDESGTDLWTDNKPSDIENFYDLAGNSMIPLSNGSYGTSTAAPVNNPTEYERLLLGAWGKNKDSQQYDQRIYDLDYFKPTAVIDCAYPVSVKNAIIDLCDYRGDLVFFADLGTKYDDLSSIITASQEINTSRFVAIYHNYFNMINPYTKKEITVTMPFLLAKRLVNHVSGGVGRPFAGLANDIYFPEIIINSVNFLPVEVPGEDQKQKLVDSNINYLSYYDGTAVMETMYCNSEDYTQLSYLHNIMLVQEIIRTIRSRCPRTRYTFLDGEDLERYIEDAQYVINEYNSFFRSITIQYMADEAYESNNIFYATIVVRFRNFIQEEYFKIIAIN